MHPTEVGFGSVVVVVVVVVVVRRSFLVRGDNTCNPNNVLAAFLHLMFEGRITDGPNKKSNTISQTRSAHSKTARFSLTFTSKADE